MSLMSHTNRIRVLIVIKTHAKGRHCFPLNRFILDELLELTVFINGTFIVFFNCLYLI